MKRVQRVCVAHSELANGIKHFTLTNAGDVRVIRDSCCVSRGLSLVLEYIFHNAIVKATLDEQKQTIVLEQPHAEATNASDNQSCRRRAL